MGNKLKIALIIFHKNSHRYPIKWINRLVASIKNQTYTDFDVFELDYGGDNIQIYPNSNFISMKLNDHAEAHNFLLDKVFSLDYDYAANSNLDDFFSHDRLQKQLKYAEEGYDVISSNFYNVDENDRIIHMHFMDSKDIEAEAAKHHNVLAHPVLMYSKHFWTTCTKLIPTQIPVDDFELWKRSFGEYKFVICPDFLLYYRVHDKKISNPKHK